MASQAQEARLKTLESLKWCGIAALIIIGLHALIQAVPVIGYPVTGTVIAYYLVTLPRRAK